jgi:hypothetical protein
LKAGKTAGVVIAVGLAAAATGIVVVAAIARWHEHHRRGDVLATRLRDIQDVLSDCDSKLRHIEQHLTPETPGRVVPFSASHSGA